jgi:hypothetical protein
MWRGSEQSTFTYTEEPDFKISLSFEQGGITVYGRSPTFEETLVLDGGGEICKINNHDIE